MNYFYSATTDLIYPSKLLDRYKDLPDDLVEITSEEASLHMGNIELPEGKRRKKNVYPFEFEDIPQPSNDDLFHDEMVELNDRYESDTQRAVNKVASAVAWDGVTEGVKVANARAELAQLKSNYDAQSLAIINNYYGS